jgi:TolB-like protein
MLMIHFARKPRPKTNLELADMQDSTQMTISEVDVREELTFLLQSRLFQQSQRLVRFLTFTVERALSGRLEDLKEYTIGVEVYDRGSSFCPSVDSIVRGEARRLRGKLKDYYEGEGRERPIFIYYRLGSYIPLFRRNEPVSNIPIPATTRHPLSLDDSHPVIAVVPFRDLSNKPATLALANGITDELIHLLTTKGDYRVVASSTLSQFLSRGIDTRAIGDRLGVHILFEGSVKQEKTAFRITSSLVDADGFQLSSHRFDAAAADAAQLFALQETIASDLARRLSRLVDKQPESKSCLTFPNMDVIAGRSIANLAKC